MRSLDVLIGLLAAAVIAVNADVYMHNPRGSNDRGCEKGDNRQNDNRLFDSQNNGKGGYACPRAWPFSCYTMMNEAERDACNSWNADQNYDDISEEPLIADNDGVLHERGTRTPRLYYYEGSNLQIEWTNQHGCGENPRTHCDIILQYACEDTLTDDCGEPDSGKQCGPRDGIPITNSEAQRGSVSYTNFLDGGNIDINRRSRDREATVTIPFSTSFNVQSDPRFGRHETLSYYVKCRRRERNKGLWTADQNVGEDATKTRQNPGGTRYGLECPEESEYYPYWAPSPWKDIAILTDRLDSCGARVAESQNIKEKYECICPTCTAQNRLVPNNREGCTATGGTWVVVPAHNVPAPVCGPAPTTRENQLGNPIGGGKSASSYNWTLPVNIPAGKTCILRLRYNISTGDPISDSNSADVTVFGTAAQNANNSPLKDRQRSETAAYKSFVEMPTETHPAAKLGLAVNTDQYGRTFQDRSWSFEIRKPPSSGECAGKRVFNLNVRGKRGNIVQVYPAVEYDFAPSELYVTDTDCVHVQWTGSDYNPAQNANNGYGGPPNPNNLHDGGADRNNLVQVPEGDQYQPVVSLDYGFTMFATSFDRKVNLAFIGQPVEDTEACMTIESIVALSTTARTARDGNGNTPAIYLDNGQNYLDDTDDRDRYWKNCGKLSGARTPYFDGGLFRPGPLGTHYFMCTRSNSFSNRNMVGILHIQSSLLANGSIIFVVIGAAVGLAVLAAGVVSFRRRSHRAAADGTGAPGTGLVALLPFGRRNSPQLAGSTEPAAPAVPRRARPGTVVAGAAGSGAKADDVTTVTALHNHQASEAGELEFRKGDIITVLRKDDSGWWEGRTPDGKKGIFPANYVRLNN